MFKDYLGEFIKRSHQDQENIEQDPNLSAEMKLQVLRRQHEIRMLTLKRMIEVKKESEFMTKLLFGLMIGGLVFVLFCSVMAAIQGGSQ